MGLPFPSPGDLPDPGSELTSLALAGGFFTAELLGKPEKSLGYRHIYSLLKPEEEELFHVP